jgi:cysteine synthase A
MSKIFENNALTIGNTPLVRLNKVSDGAIILAKVESQNPAMSVKCRIGASMIEAAEKDGTLKAGMTIVEPTSGNTGIALAFVAAAKGYGLILTMPNSMSLERRQVVTALGAKIILTEGAKGIPAAIAKAQAIVDADPAKHIMLQQFQNPANPAIHQQTTGPEIWNDTDGEVDILVAGVGTGGTISGVSRYIKQTQGKAIQSIAVEPTSSSQITNTLRGEQPSHAPHKIQGIGAGFIPQNLDLSLIDSCEQISNEDAMSYAHRLMREEGILVGISSGAAVAAAVRVSKYPENAGKTIVVILPDSAERYLTTALFAGMFTDNETVQ